VEGRVGQKMLKTPSLERKLKDFKVCGLDSMVFIYHFEENPYFLPLTFQIFYLLEKKKLKGITSVLSMVETLSAPGLETTPEKLKDIRQFFLREKNLLVCDVDFDIGEKTAYFRRLYGLSAPDAVQIATAQLMGADIFITNDDSFRKIKDFPILFLKDFAKRKKK